MYLSSVDIVHKHAVKHAKAIINMKSYVLPMHMQYGYSSSPFAMRRSNLKSEYEEFCLMEYNAV
jgi:hypothetical protein